MKIIRQAETRSDFHGPEQFYAVTSETGVVRVPSTCRTFADDDLTRGERQDG